MGKLENLTGYKFEKLTVIKRVANGNCGKTRWECMCECGKITDVNSGDLKSGKTLSCGCLSRELLIARSTKHGMYGSREHSTWRGMIGRCQHPNHYAYSYYGGRGIAVCERWQSFENFFSDMGYRPEGMELDRINNDQSYDKGNCRWVTHSENMRNSRLSRRWVILGIEYVSAQKAADALGVSRSMIHRMCKSNEKEFYSFPVYKDQREA